MPYEVVAEKLKTLKETELSEVAAFIDFIHFQKSNSSYEKPARRYFGMAKDSLEYPDDIDEDNKKIAQMFGVD